MGVIRYVKNTRFIFFTLLISCILLLLGPYLFVHFPRTCIPTVDPAFRGPTSHPKIVILSGGQCTSTNPKSKCRHLGHLSYYNRREYQSHHQERYELRDNFTTYFNEVAQLGYVPAWAKIQILQDELNRTSQDGVHSASNWIFWIDTDVLIVNMDIELERFIDDRYSLLVTRDRNYLNAGVFMLKVNDWSRKFLREVWRQRLAEDNEQSIMISVLKNSTFESEKHVKYLPQCSFNSYWHDKTLYGMFRPGDFAIHWAGHNYDPESFHDWELRRYFKLY